MALTLLQYANFLDTRELSWPAPPRVQRAKAKPHLVRLPQVRAVTWSVYGTLVAISAGQLYFEHPEKFIMEVALDKTIQEFKMWGSMSRKPGQPADYLRQSTASSWPNNACCPAAARSFPRCKPIASGKTSSRSCFRRSTSLTRA